MAMERSNPVAKARRNSSDIVHVLLCNIGCASIAHHPFTHTDVSLASRTGRLGGSGMIPDADSS